jgi:hypothetical protein
LSNQASPNPRSRFLTVPIPHFQSCHCVRASVPGADPHPLRGSRSWELVKLHTMSASLRQAADHHMELRNSGNVDSSTKFETSPARAGAVRARARVCRIVSNPYGSENELQGAAVDHNRDSSNAPFAYPPTKSTHHSDQFACKFSQSGHVPNRPQQVIAGMTSLQQSFTFALNRISSSFLGAAAWLGRPAPVEKAGPGETDQPIYFLVPWPGPRRAQYRCSAWC